MTGFPSDTVASRSAVRTSSCASRRRANLRVVSRKSRSASSGELAPELIRESAYPRWSEAALLPERAPDLAEHIAQFPERAVRPHRVQHGVHDILLLVAASRLDGGELFFHRGCAARPLHRLQPLDLRARHVL